MVANVPAFRSCGNSFVGVEIIAVSKCEVEIPNVIKFQFSFFPFYKKKAFEKVCVNIF